jgi:hypothetical protein
MKYKVEVGVMMPQFTDVIVEAETEEGALAIVQDALHKYGWGSWVWQNSENWEDIYEEAEDLKTTGCVEPASKDAVLTIQGWTDA